LRRQKPPNIEVLATGVEEGGEEEEGEGDEEEFVYTNCSIHYEQFTGMSF
jgi:hypothetical protein